MNIEELNDLELRGLLHSWVGKVENRLDLEHIAEVMKNILEDNDFGDEIHPVHQEHILNSYQESLNPKSWIDKEEIKKRTFKMTGK